VIIHGLPESNLSDGTAHEALCAIRDCENESDFYFNIPQGEITDLGFSCCLHEEPRTLDWCEEHCPKYYSCDKVAMALDELKERNGEE